MVTITRLAKLHSRPWAKEMIKFGLVGSLGAVIDLGILNILHLVVGTDIYRSVFWAFTAAVAFNYTLNNHWTYRRLGLRFQAKNLFKFATIAAIGLGITEVIIHLLSIEQGLNYNLAKIIAIMIVFFWNFFGNRYWTFRVKD